MYSTLTVHKFLEKVHPDVEGLTFGEMTDDQGMRAQEDWIRAQFGFFGTYYQPHVSLLLHLLDKERMKNQKNLVRVLRVVEYTGPREWVESTVARSIHGTRQVSKNCSIRAATLGEFPEVLERQCQSQVSNRTTISSATARFTAKLRELFSRKLK